MVMFAGYWDFSSIFACLRNLLTFFTLALGGWYKYVISSHLDDASGNLETRVEANLQRSFANQTKIGQKPDK